jgi:hypothetical protein
MTDSALDSWSRTACELQTLDSSTGRSSNKTRPATITPSRVRHGGDISQVWAKVSSTPAALGSRGNALRPWEIYPTVV